MKDSQTNMTSKATALVEDHSFLATLLAVLCLVFAVNFFLNGPGSDGGSGLGGTGKFGGESGLGGTGKMPDGGAGFKLGASDADRDLPRQNEDVLDAQSSPLKALHAELDIVTPRPDFDVASLKLSPPPASLLDELDGFAADNDRLDLRAVDNAARQETVATLVADITLDNALPTFNRVIADEQQTIAADTLVASLDILNGLMLAEAATEIVANPVVATSATDENDAIRQRINVPVRPERPDRFTMPTRVAPVQRVDVPTPPPVRPMRTLSSLLSH